MDLAPRVLCFDKIPTLPPQNVVRITRKAGKAYQVYLPREAPPVDRISVSIAPCAPTLALTPLTFSPGTKDGQAFVEILDSALPPECYQEGEKLFKEEFVFFVQDQQHFRVKSSNQMSYCYRRKRSIRNRNYGKGFTDETVRYSKHPPSPLCSSSPPTEPLSPPHSNNARGGPSIPSPRRSVIPHPCCSGDRQPNACSPSTAVTSRPSAVVEHY